MRRQANVLVAGAERMQPMPDVLCPELYRLLATRIPNGGQVLVANQGEHMSGQIGRQGPDSRWMVTMWGETYRVNCPFCFDTRARLWVNHRFGQPDPVNPGARGDFYGICFNDNCLAEHANRERLWDMLFGHRNRGRRQAPPVIRMNAGQRVDGRLTEKPWPGSMELLTAMPDDSYPKAWLMHARRFDNTHFEKYDIRYCYNATHEYRAASGRIIVPFYVGGALVGWQGRYVGEPPDKRIPKYYTCPGLRKTAMLYNYDAARGKPYVVVFEGVTDVWRFGDCSVAMLGKELAPAQRMLLESTWTSGEPIIFCLDADAGDASAAAMHAIAARGRNPVVNVKLPVGQDPAELSRDALYGIIREHAANCGVRI